jgi:hypothetical protein
MGKFRRREVLKKAVHSAALPFLRVPPLLWSKGVGSFCDFAGPRWYRYAPTESVQTEAFFRKHYSGAHGVIWLRLSTRARESRVCDLDIFAEAILPAIKAPFALVTTDGDASVPSNLAKDTAERLLASPFLVSWYTQNCDGDHPRLKPFPIGLDLHTLRSFSTPGQLARLLEAIRRRQDAPERRPLRIFCDLNLSRGPRGRRDLVDALKGCPHVDFLGKRLSQRSIWERYAQYPLVLSTAGSGLDCHRTWELLYLGCIVVTKTSPLDPLYEGLPVIIVDDWHQVRDPEMMERWVGQVAHLTDRDYLWQRLRPQSYLEPIRQELEQRRSVPITTEHEVSQAWEDRRA